MNQHSDGRSGDIFKLLQAPVDQIQKLQQQTNDSKVLIVSSLLLWYIIRDDSIHIKYHAICDDPIRHNEYKNLNSCFAINKDGIKVIMPTLRRQLKSLGLCRRKAKSDVLDVALLSWTHVACIWNEMHPIQFSRHSEDCTAPAANPRSSRSSAEAVEPSQQTPVHKPSNF